jgi:UDP-glucose 4-epimerase
MKKVLITGCAGFIGSHLVDCLIRKKVDIIGVDNLKTGRLRHIKKYLNQKKIKFYKIDICNFSSLNEIFKKNKNIDTIFHLAANADVRFGLLKPKKDFRNNILATFNLLECARINRAKKFIFSSTGSIYGEAISIPTKENAEFPIQTSIYGASKLSSEGLIQAYSEGYRIKSYIYRFVSILGDRYSHGHVYDFFEKLKKNPNKIDVLGDGNQRKSYLNIHDCVRAILLSISKKNNDISSVYNLGTDEYINVKQSLKIICNYLKVKPKVSFLGGKRGWVGDNPFIYLSCKKIRKLGWKPKFTIKDSIIQTLKWLESNNWIFNEKR